MTTAEEFKVAFLRVCADRGLSTEETADCAEKAAAYLEKSANPLLAGLLSLGRGLFVDVPRTAVSTFGPYALGGAAVAGLGLPLAAGIGGGMALQQATGPDTTLDEARANELISEYDRLAAQARRHSALRQFRDKILPNAGRRI